MNIDKYNIPIPRYTSYPTVPFWNNKDFTVEGFEQTLQTSYWAGSKDVSLYIHLPFCESLCTYCACNTRITKNHSVEEPYIDYLLKEWSLYIERLPDIPRVREIHLGGGTPTFFSAANLEKLIKGILEKATTSEDVSMSFEGHPANTTKEHLRLLNQLSFDRLSLGIQDFDPMVQKLINRTQTFDEVKTVTEQARDLGYSSVNFDMVYGLPGQNLNSLNETLDKLALLLPDRIAYYSYAHVPGLKPAQKSYEHYLPGAEQKHLFKQIGKNRFQKLGYEEVGMDHFVKPQDELMLALEAGQLHRNFMGYTPFPGKLVIGLGVSAISDSWTGFAQNVKNVEAYYELLDAGSMPIIKGHLLTREDLFIRQQILNLMCKFQTTWSESELLEFGLSTNYQLLEMLAAEGYIELSDNGVVVLLEGKDLLRVICSAFDARLNNSGKAPQFSSSV
ncbi:MAG: oxygen-independent coproporphyrinogen III oxidase [Cyclobacteriaceae bacterium]